MIYQSSDNRTMNITDKNGNAAHNWENLVFYWEDYLTIEPGWRVASFMGEPDSLAVNICLNKEYIYSVDSLNATFGPSLFHVFHGIVEPK